MIVVETVSVIIIDDKKNNVDSVSSESEQWLGK